MVRLESFSQAEAQFFHLVGLLKESAQAFAGEPLPDLMLIIAAAKDGAYTVDAGINHHTDAVVLSILLIEDSTGFEAPACVLLPESPRCAVQAERARPGERFFLRRTSWGHGPPGPSRGIQKVINFKFATHASRVLMDGIHPLGVNAVD